MMRRGARPREEPPRTPSFASQKDAPPLPMGPICSKTTLAENAPPAPNSQALIIHQTFHLRTFFRWHFRRTTFLHASRYTCCYPAAPRIASSGCSATQPRRLGSSSSTQGGALDRGFRLESIMAETSTEIAAQGARVARDVNDHTPRTRLHSPGRRRRCLPGWQLPPSQAALQDGDKKEKEADGAGAGAAAAGP